MNSEDAGGQTYNPYSELLLTHQISMETLIRVLISKGIISIDELLSEQEKMNAMMLSNQADLPAHYSAIRKNSRLKRFASKQRWSRKLTAFLFGWQWKKVKNHLSSGNETS